MKMIPANILDRQFFMHQNEYEQKALEVLRSGWYILGKEVASFEDEFAAYTDVKHCVGLASGLDALIIAFKMLGIGKGDEVIVQGNAYIACIIGITANGATPVFVEPDAYHSIDSDKIHAKITSRTKAILVVHLYGQPANMESILNICKKNNLRLVEDCAQSHGSTINGKMTGCFGDISCFSFYPSKNLGAFGDAGALITNSSDIAQETKIYRNYGSEKRYHNKIVGTNSRLDEIQAGFLRVKLSHINEYIEDKNRICKRYLTEIDNPLIQLPLARPNAFVAWHQFVIMTPQRDKLISFLENSNIKTLVHYPIPPHLSQAYRFLNIAKGDLPITEEYADSVLSLPLYNGMADEECSYVIEKLNQFGG